MMAAPAGVPVRPAISQPATAPGVTAECYSNRRVGLVIANSESQGPESDDDLVALMARGNGSALSDVIERHGNRIAALARRMLGPGGDIDDVVQETFIRLWQRAALWQPGRAQLSTWLYRVASNLSIDRLRRSQTVSFDRAPAQVDNGPPPDARIAASEALSLIDAALQSLAPRQRLAITLCHHQELSNIDAADVMGISVEALESLLSRGRRKLKGELMADREWLMDAVARGQMVARQNVEGGADEH